MTKIFWLSFFFIFFVEGYFWRLAFYDSDVEYGPNGISPVLDYCWVTKSRTEIYHRKKRRVKVCDGKQKFTPLLSPEPVLSSSTAPILFQEVYTSLSIELAVALVCLFHLPVHSFGTLGGPASCRRNRDS